MNTYRFVKIGLLAGILPLLAVGCKKDKDEEGSKNKFMDGTISYFLSEYHTTGTTISLEASGISSPGDDSLTYYWRISGHADTLFGKKINWTFPNEPGTFEVTGGARCPGYYTSAITKQTVVIYPEFQRAILDLNLEDTHSFTDTRDGRVYLYKNFGTRDWFVQNLGWDQVGKVYRGEGSLRFLFGGLYNWEEACTACPEGWRLPTAEDWESLASTAFFDDWTGLAPAFCADAKLNGEKMWLYHPYNAKTNTRAWNALPTGCMTAAESGEQYKGLQEYGFWWTGVERNPDQAYYRYLQYNTDKFSYEGAHKQFFYASVRCVRDAQ